MKIIQLFLILAILLISSQAIEKGKPKIKENYDDVELPFDGKITMPGRQYVFSGSLNPSNRILEQSFSYDYWFYLQNNNWKWENQQQKEEEQDLQLQQSTSKDETQKPLLADKQKEQDHLYKLTKQNLLLKNVKLEKHIEDPFEQELFNDYSSPLYRKHELNPAAFVFALTEIYKCEIHVNDHKKVELKIKQLFNKKEVRFDLHLQFKTENHQQLKEYFKFLSDSCTYLGKRPDYYYKFKNLYKQEQKVLLCQKLQKQHHDDPKLKKKCEKKQKKYCKMFYYMFNNMDDCLKYTTSKEMRMSLAYLDQEQNVLVETGLSRRLRSKNSQKIKRQIIQN